MSHEDSLDEETKRLLAEVESDDSRELHEQPSVKDKESKKNVSDDFNEYEESDTDPLKDKSMDDKDW